jgi:hypothetical protein
MQRDKRVHELLAAMKAARIGLIVSIPDQWGSRTLNLGYDEVLRYLDDPIGFQAKYYNVTKRQFQGWLLEDGAVQCSHMIDDYRRCQIAVRGCQNVHPKDWVRNSGRLCHVHTPKPNPKEKTHEQTQETAPPSSVPPRLLNS